MKINVKPSALNKKLRYGGYTVVLTLFLVAIVVVINTAVGMLEDRFGWAVDVTSNQIYSLTKETHDIIGQLDQEVYIYTLFRQSEQAYNDIQQINRILAKYDQASDKIHVENIDPILNPSFLSQFPRGQEVVYGDGRMVVSNKDKTRYQVYTEDDFFDAEMDAELQMTYTGLQVEQCVTLGMLNVTSDDLPRALFLEGHGEYISEYTKTLLKKRSFLVDTVNLFREPDKLKADDSLIVYAPQSDLSADEMAVVENFINNGGRAVFVMGFMRDTLPNFNQVFSLVGVTHVPNIVLESDSSYYYMSPSYIVPMLDSHSITLPLRLNKQLVLLQNTSSFAISPTLPENVEVRSLLTVNDSAYYKSNWDSDVVDKEDGDVSGPFDLAIAAQIRRTANTKENARVVLFGTGNLVFEEESYAYFTNNDMFVNAMIWLRNEGDLIQIAPKSTLSTALVLPNNTMMYTLMVLLIGVIPAIVLAGGVVVWLRRRHL